MLHYLNGRFCADSFSFILPDGFYLETVPELCYEEGFGAWTPDKQNYIEWQIEVDCGGTKEELSKLFVPGTGMHLLEDIKEVEVNGVRGHMAFYRMRTDQVMEMRLGHPRGAQLCLLIRSGGKDIHALLETKDIKNVITGIHATDLD